SALPAMNASGTMATTTSSSSRSRSETARRRRSPGRTLQGYDLGEVDGGDDLLQGRHVDLVSVGLDHHAIGEDGRELPMAAVLAVFLAHRARAVLVDLLDPAVRFLGEREVGPARDGRQAAHAA